MEHPTDVAIGCPVEAMLTARAASWDGVKVGEGVGGAVGTFASLLEMKTETSRGGTRVREDVGVAEDLYADTGIRAAWQGTSIEHLVGEVARSSVTPIWKPRSTSCLGAEVVEGVGEAEAEWTARAWVSSVMTIGSSRDGMNM
jgi:hypothetical protein